MPAFLRWEIVKKKKCWTDCPLSLTCELIWVWAISLPTFGGKIKEWFGFAILSAECSPVQNNHQDKILTSLMCLRCDITTHHTAVHKHSYYTFCSESGLSSHHSKKVVIISPNPFLVFNLDIGPNLIGVNLSLWHFFPIFKPSLYF